MSNPFGVPEMSVQDLAAERSRDPHDLVVLDVREQFEWELAAIPGDDVVSAPMSELAEHGPGALPFIIDDKSTPIAVLCHHGIRSAEVAAWLMSLGWKNVRNVAGGIDHYAQLIDPSVGAYE